jgi:steroid delta-isomerase-like uncharacterized protein
MSTETNKATVRRMAEQVYNARQLDLIGEFFTEDFVSHTVGAPAINGLEELRAGIATALDAYPDFKLTLDDLIAEGDKVAARWTSRGTHQGELLGVPATGKLITQEGMVFYRMVNAQIAEVWFHPDSLGMMQQLGIVPALAEA